jgi:hypothetical protein
VLAARETSHLNDIPLVMDGVPNAMDFTDFLAILNFFTIIRRSHLHAMNHVLV